MKCNYLIELSGWVAVCLATQVTVKKTSLFGRSSSIDADFSGALVLLSVYCASTWLARTCCNSTTLVPSFKSHEIGSSRPSTQIFNTASRSK